MDVIRRVRGVAVHSENDFALSRPDGGVQALRDKPAGVPDHADMRLPGIPGALLHRHSFHDLAISVGTHAVGDQHFTIQPFQVLAAKRIQKRLYMLTLVPARHDDRNFDVRILQGGFPGLRKHDRPPINADKRG